MADSIDRLEIQVQTQAQQANNELDKLANKLEKVSNVLSRVNGSGVQGLSNGINRLSVSMQNMSAVKTIDFTRLANNIEKLGSINQAGINNTASALRQISSALTATSGMTGSVQQLSELTNGISRLGYKSVTNAITNLPLLAQSMRQFMATLSTAPQVSANLIQMTNAMANLAAQGSKYGSTIKSMANATKSFTRVQDNAYKSNVNFIASLSKLTVAYYILRRAIRSIFQPIQKAMDFGETINLFQTSFKKIGMVAAQDAGMAWGSEAAEAYAVSFVKEAQKFNDTITEDLSLDPNTVMNYQAVFAQMANAFGLTSKSVMNLSNSFTLLGLDIASFFNTDVEEAMVKLRAGLAGETEPLRTLGVDITEATLKMIAMKYGIEGTVSEMSQATKTQLRWLAIMEQTETVFGDMAKTIQSPANQMRILNQQWENFTKTLGQIFIPFMTRILPYINAFVMAIQRMASVIAGAMGYELPDYTQSEVYSDISGSFDGIGESADGANDSVKELKKSLAGFDKLNVLSENKPKSSSIDTSGGIPILDDAISQKTDSYLKKFNDELDKMYNKSKDISDKITKFYDEVLAPMMGATVDEIVIAFFDAFNSLLGTVQAFSSKFDNGDAKTIGDFFDDMTNLTPGGVTEWFTDLAKAFDSLTAFINNPSLETFSQTLEDVFGAFLSAPTTPKTGWLTDRILDITGIDLKGWYEEHVKPYLTGEVSISVAISEAGEWVGKTVDFIVNIPQTAGEIAGKFTELAGEWVGKTVDFIVNIPQAAGEIAGKFTELAGEWVGKTVNFIVNISQTAGEIAGKFTELAGEWVGKTVDFIVNIPQTAGEIAGKFTELAGEWVGKTVDFIVNIPQTATDIIKKYSLLAVEWVGKTVEFLIKIPQTAADIISALGKLAEQWVGKTVKFLVSIPQTWDNLKKKFHDLYDKFTGKKVYFKASIPQVWSDLSSKYKTLYDNFKGKIVEFKINLITSLGDITAFIGELIDRINTEVLSKLTITIDIPFTDKDWTWHAPLIPNPFGGNHNEHTGSGITGGRQIVKPYARGGFPNSGEMFIARENGIPEMVGRIGNRTAVANNDQIASALEEAAYRGYVRAIADTKGYSGNTNVTVALEGDAKGLFKVIQKGSREYYNMTGLAPFPA